jgi:hypothetical protein
VDLFYHVDVLTKVYAMDHRSNHKRLLDWNFCFNNLGSEMIGLNHAMKCYNAECILFKVRINHKNFN